MFTLRGFPGRNAQVSPNDMFGASPPYALGTMGFTVSPAVTRSSPLSPFRLSTPDLVEQLVHEMLVWRCPFDTSRVRVDVKGDVVTLSGRMGSSYDIYEACRLARVLPGVARVDSLLCVG